MDQIVSELATKDEWAEVGEENLRALKKADMLLDEVVGECYAKKMGKLKGKLAGKEDIKQLNYIIN